MQKLLLMIQFLTRIPVPVSSRIDDKEFRDGIVFFPMVGLLIGMFVVSIYYIGYLLGGKFLASVAAVSAEAFITGGLHLDGLGDTFDGVYSNRQKERVLEIMKDSRLGTNGALAILFTVLLKIALIYNAPFPDSYPILLLMPVFSRLSIIFASRFSRYARENGLGNIFIGKIHNGHVIISVLWCCIFSLIYIWALAYLPIVFIFSLYYTKHITNIIDGMTGDTLGALCEISEVVYLIYFSILLLIGR